MLGYTLGGGQLWLCNTSRKETLRKYIEINIAHSAYGFVVENKMRISENKMTIAVAKG